MSDACDAPPAASREVLRSQRDLAKRDSPYRRAMWRGRLETAAKLWEAAAAILRTQIAAIDRSPR